MAVGVSATSSSEKITEDRFVGYCEEVSNKKKFKLTRHFFPSKFGGKPAWLSPCVKKIACELCARPMSFMMQVYAPVESNPSGFHRTLFVFFCHRCKDQFKVVRSQLPLKNPFYPATAATHAVQNDPLYEALCQHCGCMHAPSTGSRTDSEMSCSDSSRPAKRAAERQKKPLTQSEPTNQYKCRQMVLPEMKISVEEAVEEETDDGTQDLQKELTEMTKLLQDNPLVESSKQKTPTLFNIPEDEEEDDDEMLPHGISAQEYLTGGGDPCYETFLNFSERNTGHVLMYSRGGSPLWIQQKNQCHSVPKCERCHKDRVFEFQVQAAVLAQKGVNDDSMDFAVLAVYTCDCELRYSQATGNNSSCACDGCSYASEFVHVQKEPETWWNIKTA